MNLVYKTGGTMKKLLLIISFFSLVACGDNKTAQIEKKEVVKLARTIELNEQNLEYVKDYNGELKPVNEVTIITPTGGDVKKINFKNGDRVKKGDVILELTDASTEASYYEAEGNLLKAKSSYSTDKISYEKYKKLFAKELVSEDEFLNSKNKYETSLGGLKIAEANFIRAKDNFSRLKVTAKIDGTITDLDLKEFEKVPASQKILTIVDNSSMELVIAVSGKDTEFTEVGGKAEVLVEELGEKLEGTITEINLSSDSNTKKYSVKLSVKNENQRLLKGLYAKVKLQQGYIKGLFVPKQAIMIKDLYSYIVISRNNTAVIYKITPDITIGDEQMIEFPDYQTGDRVVVEGQYLLNNNDKIKEN